MDAMETTQDHKPPTKAKKAANRNVSREAAGMPSKRPKEAPMVNDKDTGSDHVHGVARDQLRSIVERIERLEEEKQSIADDIKDMYAEAKGNGFDTKALRRIIALRKQDQNERLELEATVDTYMAALGMLGHWDD